MSTTTAEPGRVEGPEKPERCDEKSAGDLIDACAIDLPRDDVVEAIEFERFFVLNLRFQEFQRPATLMSMWVSMGSGISDAEEPTLAPVFDRGAPFSSNRATWESASRRDAAGGAARADWDPPGSPQDQPEAGPAGPQTHLGAGGTPIDIGDFRLAFYLPYKQEWKLRGYNRGRMISSLTLGPQEEQTIEIFTWDRNVRTLESTTAYEFEQTMESSGTRRDTTDIARDIGRQAGFELTSDAKVGFKVEVVNADISAGMNAKTSLNSSEKDTRQSIVEATSRAATHVRSSRTLKVVETHEYGQETRVTRKLRNHNTCHTLTTAFFEILANYKVSTVLRTDSIRLVVLLKSSELSKIKTFDRRTIRSHERTLSLSLLDSTLAAGLQAARYLDARERACAVLCASCECLEAGAASRSQEWDDLAAALDKLGKAVADLRSYVVLFPVSVLLAEAEVPIGPGIGAKDIKRHMFMRALSVHAPRLLVDLAGLSLASGSLTPAVADSAMAVIRGLAPENLALLGADRSISESEWWLIFGVIFPSTPADPITQFAVAAGRTAVLVGAIGGLATFDDGGLVAAMNGVKAAYAAWQTYLAEAREDDEKLAALERIAKEERALRVLDAFPLRETADAQERLEALLDHLNDERNVDHYRFAIWNERAGSNDPQLLALALAGFTDGAPVGVVGDDLAVPLRIPPQSVLESFFRDSVADLVAMSPRDDDDHILPTAALYAEAIPGACCACEDNVVRSEELDLKRKELENSLVTLESERLTARSAAEELDGPTVMSPIRVEVVNATMPDELDHGTT